MDIRKLNGSRIITKLNPSDSRILSILYKHQENEYSTAQMANLINKSIDYTRTRLNKLANHQSEIVQKHKEGGSAPWHPDLGRRGGPVTRANVQDYMKRRGIKWSAEKEEELFKNLWEEGEVEGGWVSLARSKYAANPNLNIQRQNGTIIVTTKTQSSNPRA